MSISGHIYADSFMNFMRGVTHGVKYDNCQMDGDCGRRIRLWNSGIKAVLRQTKSPVKSQVSAGAGERDAPRRNEDLRRAADMLSLVRQCIFVRRTIHVSQG